MVYGVTKTVIDMFSKIYFMKGDINTNLRPMYFILSLYFNIFAACELAQV